MLAIWIQLSLHENSYENYAIYILFLATTVHFRVSRIINLQRKISQAIASLKIFMTIIQEKFFW